MKIKYTTLRKKSSIKFVIESWSLFPLKLTPSSLSAMITLITSLCNSWKYNVSPLCGSGGICGGIVFSSNITLLIAW
jgi:hypothetical protein